MVELVSAQTELRRQGSSYMGLCPFHEERSPSFSVDPVKKLCHCFGCGAGGDVFYFVMETENIDFPSAVELLADRYGIEVKREQEDPEAERRRAQRHRLYEVMERAALFYSTVFAEGGEAAKAREYLAGRGLDAGVLAEFGVGYAPSAWDTLMMRAQRAGYKLAELEHVGLAVKGRSGGTYDRFRERITFPIRDLRGRVIGFGARAMRPEQKPKYLNSPETELFHKSDVLYGIDRARQAIAKSGRVVVVEGYTDVIALHQAGLAETVGIMGTAITDSQLGTLSGLVDTVVLALDADNAGSGAMLRAQEVAAGRRLNIRVAAMPEGEDPAEMVAAGQIDRFRELVDGAVDLVEFHVELILGGVDPSSPRDRDRGLAETVPVLAGLEEGATRDELTRRVAGRLGLDPNLVVSRVAAGPVDAPPAPVDQPMQPQPAAPVLTHRERSERWLLAMCIARPEEGRGWLEKLEPRHLTSPLTVRAVEWLRGHLEDPAEGLDPSDRELHRLIAALVARARPERVGEGSMRRNFMELELAALDDDIRTAAEAGDDARRAELLAARFELAHAVRRAEDAGSPD